MIWFQEQDAPGEIRRPNWSDTTHKAGQDDPIQSVIVGQGVVDKRDSDVETFSSAPGAQPPQDDAPPSPLPDPIPEPPPDPRVEIQLKLLAGAISELATATRSAQERDMAFCIDLGLVIARELACGALSASPQRVADIVHQATDFLDESQSRRVRIHPEIMSAFNEKHIAKSLEDIPNVVLIEDASVSKLGCVVESPPQVVDAQIENRLTKLRAIFDELKGEKV